MGFSLFSTETNGIRIWWCEFRKICNQRFQPTNNSTDSLTLAGRTSMVIIIGTDRSPVCAMNTVNDSTYIGTQLVFGSWSLYKWCNPKMSIPSPVPIDDVVNRILRPSRSIKNIVDTFATSWTTQIKSDDWIGVKDDPASAKKSVVYDSNV